MPNGYLLKKFEAHRCRSDASNLDWMLNHVWVHTWNCKERELKLLPGYWSDSKIVQNLSKDTQWLFVKAWWDLNSAIWRPNSVSNQPKQRNSFYGFETILSENPTKSFKMSLNLCFLKWIQSRKWWRVNRQELEASRTPFHSKCEIHNGREINVFGSIFVSHRWFESIHVVSSI